MPTFGGFSWSTITSPIQNLVSTVTAPAVSKVSSVVSSAESAAINAANQGTSALSTTIPNVFSQGSSAASSGVQAVQGILVQAGESAGAAAGASASSASEAVRELFKSKTTITPTQKVKTPETITPSEFIQNLQRIIPSAATTAATIAATQPAAAAAKAIQTLQTQGVQAGLQGLQGISGGLQSLSGLVSQQKITPSQIQPRQFIPPTPQIIIPKELESGISKISSTAKELGQTGLSALSSGVAGISSGLSGGITPGLMPGIKGITPQEKKTFIIDGGPVMAPLKQRARDFNPKDYYYDPKSNVYIRSDRGDIVSVQEMRAKLSLPPIAYFPQTPSQVSAGGVFVSGEQTLAAQKKYLESKGKEVSEYKAQSPLTTLLESALQGRLPTEKELIAPSSPVRMIIGGYEPSTETPKTVEQMLQRQTRGGTEGLLDTLSVIPATSIERSVVSGLEKGALPTIERTAGKLAYDVKEIVGTGAAKTGFPQYAISVTEKTTPVAEKVSKALSYDVSQITGTVAGKVGFPKYAVSVMEKTTAPVESVARKVTFDVGELFSGKIAPIIPQKAERLIPTLEKIQAPTAKIIERGITADREKLARVGVTGAGAIAAGSTVMGEGTGGVGFIHPESITETVPLSNKYQLAERGLPPAKDFETGTFIGKGGLPLYSPVPGSATERFAFDEYGKVLGYGGKFEPALSSQGIPHNTKMGNGEYVYVGEYQKPDGEIVSRYINYDVGSYVDFNVEGVYTAKRVGIEGGGSPGAIADIQRPVLGAETITTTTITKEQKQPTGSPFKAAVSALGDIGAYVASPKFATDLSKVTTFEPTKETAKAKAFTPWSDWYLNKNPVISAVGTGMAKLQMASDKTMGFDIARQEDYMKSSQTKSNQAAIEAEDANRNVINLQNQLITEGKLKYNPSDLPENQLVFTDKMTQGDYKKYNDLSSVATTKYNAYTKAASSALADQKKYVEMVQPERESFITSGLLPYERGAIEAQEKLKESAYVKAEELGASPLIPKSVQPYTKAGLEAGVGFVSVLPYLTEVGMAATQIVPLAPSNIELAIRKPGYYAAVIPAALVATGAGLTEQVKKLAAPVTGEEVDRYWGTVGEAGGLVLGRRPAEKGVTTLKLISPIKVEESFLPTGRGIEIKSTPLGRPGEIGGSIVSKIPVVRSVFKEGIKELTTAERKPETVSYTGLYYESPIVGIQKAIGLKPEGYVAPGGLKPIVGYVRPTEGASWFLRPKTEILAEPGKKPMALGEYTPRLTLEREGALYKPKEGALPTFEKTSPVTAGIISESPALAKAAKDISAARSIISPKGKLITGTPYELTQYVEKEGFVPDFASMYVATPLMHELFKKVGVKEAENIYTAQMKQFKNIWQMSSKPEIVRNPYQVLEKTAVIPKQKVIGGVVYPSRIPEGAVSDWSGLPIPKNAKIGEAFHHTAYPDKGVWLTPEEHTNWHNMLEGKYPVDPIFFKKYAITIPKTEPFVEKLTTAERKNTIDDFVSILKKYKDLTIGGSLTEYVQAKKARLPKDFDGYTENHQALATELGMYYKKHYGNENVKINLKSEGSSIDVNIDGKWEKMVDLHHKGFGGQVGTIGRYGVKTEAPITVEGLNFMPLREQRLRKLTATMAVQKTPEGKFFPSAMDTRRFKDIGDVLGSSTSMEATAIQDIFGKRKAAGLAETRTTLEKMIGEEYPITAEQKQTARKRFEAFEPVEPMGTYWRTPLTRRYVTPDIIPRVVAKGAAVAGTAAAAVGGAAIASGVILPALSGAGYTPSEREKELARMGISGVAIAGLTRTEEFGTRRGIRELSKTLNRREINTAVKKGDLDIIINPLEFEGTPLTPIELSKVSPKTQRYISLLERNIIKQGTEISEDLKQNPRFTQKQVTDMKPEGVSQKQWDQTLDALVGLKNNAVLSGSKVGDVFLKKGVGRDVSKSDNDIFIDVSKVDTLQRTLKKIYPAPESSKLKEGNIFIAASDPSEPVIVNGKLVNAESLQVNRYRYDIAIDEKGNKVPKFTVLEEPVIEVHTFEKFPSVKQSITTIELPNNKKINVASPEYMLRSKLGGSFKTALIEPKGKILMEVKRLKDYPDVISRTRQISSDLYKQADALAKSGLDASKILEKAKLYERLSRTYTNYLFSKDVLKSKITAEKRGAKGYTDIELQKLLDQYIEEGIFPETTKISTPEFKQTIREIDPEILQALSSPIPEYVKGSISEVREIRSKVNKLENPLKEINTKEITRKVENVAQQYQYSGRRSAVGDIIGLKPKAYTKPEPTPETLADLYLTKASERVSRTPLREKTIDGTKRISPRMDDSGIDELTEVSSDFITVTKMPTQDISIKRVSSLINKKTVSELTPSGYSTLLTTLKEEGITYPVTPKYAKMTEYPSVVATYPRIRAYPEVSTSIPIQAYSTQGEYPTTIKYPTQFEYAKYEQYPSVTSYPTMATHQKYPEYLKYPEVTTYPAYSKYPEVTTYPGYPSYPTGAPYIKYPKYPTYTPIIPYTPITPIITTELITTKLPRKTKIEVIKRKRKKKMVPPRHWEYGPGATPAEVSSFIFGAPEKPRPVKTKPTVGNINYTPISISGIEAQETKPKKPATKPKKAVKEEYNINKGSGMFT
jgi:hypothetical protein